MATFTNQARLSYKNSVVNSNIAVGEIIEVLSATKTSVGESYRPGDSVTYIVSIVNSGTTQYTGLTLLDNLGEYEAGANTLYPLTYEDGSIEYFINGVVQAAPAVTAGPPLTVSGITVPAAGNAMIIYKANVNEFAPPTVGSTITNTVTVDGSCAEVTAMDTVTVESVPNLSIAKSISPVPVSESGTLTYTFLLQNSGNVAADAEDLVTITDTFDPALTNLAVSLNGTKWEEGTNYTYNQQTGVFATVAGQVTVPAAAYTQDIDTGVWTVTPGISTLVVSGTIQCSNDAGTIAGSSAPDTDPAAARR